MLASITKSDEQSPPRYATNPLSLGQETLRIALARTITPTPASWELNSQLRRKPTSPLIRPAPATPHADDHQSLPRTPAEPPQRPGSPRPRALGAPAPSPRPQRPGHPVTPSHQDPSAPSLMIFTPRVLPGTMPRSHSTNQAKPVSVPLAKRNQTQNRGAQPPPQPTREEGQRRASHQTGGHSGGPGIRVSSPRKSTASQRRRGRKPRA